MNRVLLLSAAFGLFAARPLVAADPAAPGPRAEVTFDHPENFTDIKDHYEPTAQGEAAILDEIRAFIVNRAGSFVPPGDRLAITFTDIDLAGDFEPWHGPDFDDIRIVKDIYPPAFKFTYRITDARGAVLKQGRENIRDLDFQMRVTLNESDPLRYEKDILEDWMRQACSDLKKS